MCFNNTGDHVMIPMMPKGVEHKRNADMMLVTDKGDDSNDAERR